VKQLKRKCHHGGSEITAALGTFLVLKTKLRTETTTDDMSFIADVKKTDKLDQKPSGYYR
jgi:hypothetical protein